MPRLAIECVEIFHLLLLRMFEARLDRSSYVVKGGVNLRAWFGSERYSEDLDIDVLRGESYELKDKVDALLASKPFRGLLETHKLVLTRSSKPKQTETTQRWKFELAAEGLALPLHTKVEFSRRGADDDYILEPVRAEIVRRYGISAPTANHYSARSAIAQKIRALAGRTETQARDIWDLDHLLRTTSADLRAVSEELAALIPTALERLADVSYDTFKAQVVPFLEPQQQELHRDRERWARIVELVWGRLAELAS